MTRSTANMNASDLLSTKVWWVQYYLGHIDIQLHFSHVQWLGHSAVSSHYLDCKGQVLGVLYRKMVTH